MRPGQHTAWIVIGLLALWQLVAWGAARLLIVGDDDPQRADALVVLGGSAVYLERNQAAARLFHEGRAPRILLTNDGLRGGWSPTEQRNPFFVERAVSVLQSEGVPADRIGVLPGVVSSTYDEAVLLRRYAAQHNLRSLLVTTSAYHTRRARWTFGTVFSGSGIEVAVYPVPPGRQTPFPTLWWLSPRGWQTVAAEYVKLLVYRLRHG